VKTASWTISPNDSIVPWIREKELKFLWIFRQLLQKVKFVKILSGPGRLEIVFNHSAPLMMTHTPLTNLCITGFTQGFFGSQPSRVG
jgi:hypothetical protein